MDDEDAAYHHEDDLFGKYRAAGWLLVIAIAAVGIALLLKKYDVF